MHNFKIDKMYDDNFKIDKMYNDNLKSKLKINLSMRIGIQE